MNVTVRALDTDDFGYALSSWRESHKQAPGVDRVPWPYYRSEWGEKFRAIINDPGTLMLGAYTEDDHLAGWLAATPGKWARLKGDGAGNWIIMASN